jgi:hypothetical protein
MDIDCKITSVLQPRRGKVVAFENHGTHKTLM